MEQWSEKLDFKSIGMRYGSPLYVFNIEELKKNFISYVRLAGHPFNIAYPVKANPSIAVLRELCKLGGRVDCASMREMLLAQRAGFKYRRILYNTPAPEIDHALFLLRRGGTVVADSLGILNEMDAAYAREPFEGQVFVRVNPKFPVSYGSSRGYHNLTSHAAGKFGIASEELEQALAGITVPVVGLHTHVGTQMDQVSTFVGMMRFLHKLMDRLNKKTNHMIRTIDLGGGLGINLSPEDSFPTIDALRESLLKEMRDDTRYIVEPGNSLVGKAMGIITKIISLKNIRGKRIAVVDVGSDQLIAVTLAGMRRQVLDANHNPLPFTGGDELSGPLCFSGDILLPNTSIAGLSKGDYLFVRHCGSYCEALSNSFNGRTSSGMIKIQEDDTIELCQNREDWFMSKTNLTYQWATDNAIWKMPKNIDISLANSLQSDYLKTGSKEDSYEIIEFMRRSENCFEFKYYIKSSLGSLSIPFAYRIFSNATIISVLYVMGKNRKDISVWADRAVMNADAILEVNKLISLTINLSPIANRAADDDKVLVANFSTEEGHFSGFFRVKFSLR
ncbi:MAG: pyridoxal-dependent decarboxylase, pyridoxal binding domain protein [bacterium]|nr:pyridoxal-dependent decarboxylase, pyridoxal binding domain protein [bacterium]